MASVVRERKGATFVLSLGVLLLSFLSAAAVAATLSNGEWFVANVDSTTQWQYGPFDQCLKGASSRLVCSPIETNPDDDAVCDYPPWQRTAWWWGIRGGMALGGVLGVAGGACAIGGMQLSAGTSWPTASLAFAGASLLIELGGGASWWVFMPKEFTCGTLCEHLQALGVTFSVCSEGVGFYFWVYVGAAGAQLIVFILAVVNKVAHGSGGGVVEEGNEAGTEEGATAPPAEGGPPPTAAAVGGEPAAETDAAKEEDDWAYDAGTGYFYSEARGLFFDAPSEMVYDPDTNAWREPVSADGELPSPEAT